MITAIPILVVASTQSAHDKRGWVHYMNQAENPPLPVTLGQPPQ